MLYKHPIFLTDRKDILLLIIQENKGRLWAADLKHECTKGSRNLKVFRMRIKSYVYDMTQVIFGLDATELEIR